MRTLAAILASLAAFGSPDGDSEKAPHIPQAQPVVRLLRAVKDGDQKQMQFVFSKRIHKEMDDVGWDKVMKTYRDVFMKQFGAYELQEFRFEYAGSDSEGKLAVIHKGKKLGNLRLIMEGQDWKVNER